MDTVILGHPHLVDSILGLNPRMVDTPLMSLVYNVSG